MLLRRCGIATGLPFLIAIFLQQVPAPVGALVNRSASDSAQPAADQRSAEAVALSGNPVAREGTNRTADNRAADTAAFLAALEIGQFFGPLLVDRRIGGIAAIRIRPLARDGTATRIKSGVDIASIVLIGPAAPVRRHIAVADEGAGIFALIDAAVGVAIGALPFALVAAVFAIGSVPVALIGRTIAAIGRRRCNHAVIADKHARIIAGMAVAIAVIIALVIAVPVDIIPSVLDDTIAVGQNRIVIIARPAIAIIGLAQAIIAEIPDKIARLDIGFRQAIAPVRFVIALVIAHPSPAHIVAGLAIAFHLMHVAHILHAARIAHRAHAGRRPVWCRRRTGGRRGKGQAGGGRGDDVGRRVDCGNRAPWRHRQNTGNASK